MNISNKFANLSVLRTFVLLLIQCFHGKGLGTGSAREYSQKGEIIVENKLKEGMNERERRLEAT